MSFARSAKLIRTRRRLIRATRAAARIAARLPLAALPWPRTEPVVELDAVRRRLELLLAAMYGRHIPISVPDRRRESWLARAWRAVSPFTEPDIVAASDGESLRLPPNMEASSGAVDAIARYRLLAIEQAERVVRGTAVVAAGLDALERDLFLLRESAAIDAAIAHNVRNLTPALVAARAEALERRPVLEALAGAERDVEKLLRRLLAAEPSSPPEAFGISASPTESAAWARETAARLRTSQERYRGVPAVGIWGRDIFGMLNVPTEATNVVSIGVGLTHAGVLSADGQIILWGNPAAGMGADSIRATLLCCREPWLEKRQT